jgi:hypothetical protein
VFTLSTVPPNGAVQSLTANGSFLTPGVDYTLSGRTITLTVPLTFGNLYATWLNVATYSVTMNNDALANSTNATLQVYQSPPIPIGVLYTYLKLANASLVQARWQEQWYVAMGWFIAHYATLYARSDASEVFETLQTSIHGETPLGVTPGTTYVLSATPPGGVVQSLIKNGLFQTPGVDYTLVNNTITMIVPTVAGDVLYATWPVQVQAFTTSTPNGAQIAAQGLAFGIQTSKSVGDVSVSYQVLTALEDWASWNLTIYGQELATMARVIGSGPMLLW